MTHNEMEEVVLTEVLSQVSRPVDVQPDGHYRLLGVRWYGNGCRLHSEAVGSELKTRQLNRVEYGDVVYNKMWATKSAFAVVDAAHAGLVATNEYPTFAAHSDRLDPAFFKFLMLHPEFVARASDACRGSTSRARLNPGDFLQLRVRLPSLAKQRKIAAILSSIDDVTEKTGIVIERFRSAKEAMMQEFLTRGLPHRHARFKRTEIGAIPQEWRVTEIGRLARFSGGHGFRPSDWSTTGLPIIRIQNLNGSPDFNYFDATPDPSWIVEPGELLFAWAGSVGASFGPCLWAGPRGLLNQHIHRISPQPEVDRRYLFYVLKVLTTEIEKRAHGFKQALLHVKKAEITNRLVGLPSLEEQREIVAVLDSMEVGERAEDTGLSAHRQVKSALMDALLTGELPVTMDEGIA